jgi:hypothetical protein
LEALPDRDLRAHEAVVDGELDFESEWVAMERAGRTGSARPREREQLAQFFGLTVPEFAADRRFV